MRYPGSKLSLKNELVPIISNKAKDLPFYDLFCGSCNLVAYMPNKVRYANDLDENIITLLKNVVNTKDIRTIYPDFISEEEHNAVKNNPENYDPGYKAFVGYGSSFGSVYNGTYARCKANYSYALLARNSLLKIKPLIKNIIFTSKDYRAIKIPKRSLVYLDPPYNEKNTMYRISDFDVKAFWDYASNIKGCLVYISSYNAPSGFYEIWRKHKHTISNYVIGGTHAIERLFVNEETWNYITSNKTTFKL